MPDPDLVLPKDGVYAVIGYVPVRGESGQAMLVPTERKKYVGVCNVGTNPTVGGRQRTVETWLSGFAGELYGRELTVDFYHRLRDEIKFPSVDALKEEIYKNQAQAEAYFRTKHAL